MGKSRHSSPSLWDRLTRHQPNLGVRVTIAQVDLRTGRRHLLTPDAMATDRAGGGVGYIALCGQQLVPTIGTLGPKCQPCQVAAAILAQRSRKTR